MSGTPAELAFLHARQTEREQRADVTARQRAYVKGYEAALRDVAANGLDVARRAHASRANRDGGAGA